MTTRTNQLILGTSIVLSLAWSAYAMEPSTAGRPGNEPQATSQWTLSTDDTEVILSVSNNKIYIDSLKNPAQELELGSGALAKFRFPARTASPPAGPTILRIGRTAMRRKTNRRGTRLLCGSPVRRRTSN